MLITIVVGGIGLVVLSGAVQLTLCSWLHPSVLGPRTYVAVVQRQVALGQMFVDFVYVPDAFLPDGNEASKVPWFPAPSTTPSTTSFQDRAGRGSLISFQDRAGRSSLIYPVYWKISKATVSVC